MRILIAGNDITLTDGLTRSLRQAGYAVDQASNGATTDAALSAQMAQTYDLLILDVGLPRMSGLEIPKRLRPCGAMLSMLILTAAGSVEERVKDLDLGADDYIAKSFALSKLEARVRALVWCDTGSSATLVRHGPLAFDQVRRIVYIHDQVVELSAREVGLLEILLTRVGRLMSRRQLIGHLCGWDEEVSNNAIEIYIHHLRKKIEVEGIRIATVRELSHCLERVAAPTTTVTAHG